MFSNLLIIILLELLQYPLGPILQSPPPADLILWTEVACRCSIADIDRLADIISTVEFDHTGNYLATGDKGGRVVLFERNETVSARLS